MKKRSLALLCAIVLLATLAIPLVAMAGTTKYVYTSNGKSLNMRKQPITHANNRIMHIPYGAKVTVDHYVENGSWAYIQYSGKKGYVMSRYLVSEKPPEKRTSSGSSSSSSGGSSASYEGFAATSYKATIRPSAPGGFVNLRWGPSKSVRILQRMYDGQEVEVIAQNKTWAQVRVTSNGSVGFIMRAFLTQQTDAGDS